MRLRRVVHPLTCAGTHGLFPPSRHRASAAVSMRVGCTPSRCTRHQCVLWDRGRGGLSSVCKASCRLRENPRAPRTGCGGISSSRSRVPQPQREGRQGGAHRQKLTAPRRYQRSAQHCTPGSSRQAVCSPPDTVGSDRRCQHGARSRSGWDPGCPAGPRYLLWTRSPISGPGRAW